ncbi:unnamed protein product [Caenorhabditis brenneri]
MKLILISTIFLFSLIFCNAQYFPDLQKALEGEQYDPDCVFNYTHVNSKSIKKFPKCDVVYGILVINNATDLTVDQLLAGFSLMKHLKGGVRIENTTYPNISFFPITSDFVDFSVKTYGFFVRNNSELTNIGMLHKIWIYMNDNSESVFRVENNPKLDAKFMCDFGYLYMYTEIVVQGNLRDCACTGGLITSSNINQFSTCESIFSGIKLYNFTDSFDLSPLFPVEYVRGNIDIQNTNLQNLSFLSNVRDLKINNNGDRTKIMLNLQNNPQMTRFGMTLLMEIQNVWTTGIKLANFENLHPDFCLTIEEMAFFLENEITFMNLQAKLCADNRTKINDNLICNFESMGKLPENCNVIMGDLVVNPGDEAHFHKLESVRYVFGSIAVQNTSLENADMLSNIRYIVQLNDSQPVLQVVGNKKLFPFYLTKVMNLITREKRTIVFQDNNVNLFISDGGSCAVIFDKSDFSTRKLLTNTTFTGGDCGKKVNINYRYSSPAEGAQVSIVVIMVLVLVYFEKF